MAPASECDLEAATIFFAPYRIVYLVNALLSATSLFTIFHFVRNYLFASPFHPNFRIFLLGYFLSAFVHSCIFLLNEALSLSRLLSYSEPCDALIPAFPYAMIHIPLVCCLISGIIGQALLVAERLAATVMVKTYENTSPRISLAVYLIIGVLLPILLVYWAYADGDFSHAAITALTPPRGTEIKASEHHLPVIIRRGLWRSGRFTLFGDYQQETRAYNGLLAVVSLPNIGKYCYNSLHPWFAFSLPIVASWQLAKLREKRTERTRQMVAVRAKGREGSDAYTQMLQQQWSR
ncbi:unnamed protein product [Caenorhabditis auriculariae]|uniref:Uncharacterized protein n=1 Tax=Caenorhabditis auriculariae TaxID=2777116 RepID=A0A8S1HNX5_9PELO|nr:unnamed protein product [Caenorhabditis auriculariae]